ncbi:MAG: polysaccharide deacetylase family protein [Acidimicrobiia bacterium]
MTSGGTREILARLAAGGGVGLVAIPVLVPDAAGSGLALPALALAASGLTAWYVQRRAGGRILPLLGAALVVAAAVVLNATPMSGLVIAEAAGLGVGVGLVCGPARPWSRPATLGLAAGAVALALAALLGPDAAPFVVAGVLGILAAIGSLLVPSRPPPGRWPVRLSAAGAVLVLVATISWVGANDPAVAWFGPQVSHGSRHVRAVAITFDDGPNAGSTLRIARILDAHGAKGAFFAVGKAVDRRPDIGRALLADGHLVGNHSYEHDQWRWLDPRYPELGRAQAAIRQRLGVCPALYRPPHGERTWFVAHQVAGEHMQLVLWDDSAGDWATTDERLVARRILRKVKPGSIILLHDGLDGDVTADRRVVERALPIILDGLRARHLRVERLDRLLGVRPYLARC